MSDDQTYVMPVSTTPTVCAFPEIHHHYHYHQPADAEIAHEVEALREQIVDLKNLLGAVLPEIIMSLNAVTFGQANLEESMALDLSALETEVSENSSAVDSAISLLGSLAQEIRDAAGDPGRISAIADAIDANTNRLAAAVAQGTPAEPGSPTNPDEQPPVVEEPPVSEGGVTDDGTEITPTPPDPGV